MLRHMLGSIAVLLSPLLHIPKEDIDETLEDLFGKRTGRKLDKMIGFKSVSVSSRLTMER
jgi:hypothetical protein